MSDSESETLFALAIVHYGVPSVSRINSITGLFCKRALKKRLYSAEETYSFIAHTNRSHPISALALANAPCGVATVSRLDKTIGLLCRI